MQGFEKMLKMAGFDVSAMKQQATDWFQKLGAKLTEHGERLSRLETQYNELVVTLANLGHINHEDADVLLKPFDTVSDAPPETAITHEQPEATQ